MHLKQYFQIFVTNRVDADSPMDKWRGYALFSILSIMIAFGMISYVPSIITAFALKQWSAFFFFTFCYLIALFLLFSKSLSFKLRAYIMCVFTLALGINTSLAFGLSSSGRLWLLCATMLSSLLLGLRHSILMACIAVASLIGAGYATDFAATTSPIANEKLWIVVVSTFILLNIIIVMSTSVLIKGLTHSLKNESSMAKKFKKSKEAAEQSSQVKTEFLANMSHEIRTPLNGIMGMLQLMETSGLNSQQQEYCLAAVQSCKRLTSLVGDIMDISRIEAKAMTLHLEHFHPREILESLVDLFAPRATQKGITLEIEVDPALPATLHGDPTRLHQILSNLVGNAVKFSKQGSIRVTANATTGPTSDDILLVLTISDTGPGIPEHLQTHVFNTFTQAENVYTRKHEGAGLGLAIVKKLVELMQGTLKMKSEEGEGTTFTVELPFSTISSNETCPVDRPDTLVPATSPRKVLLAEDDKVNRLYLSKILELQGFTVHEAENGEEVLDALRKDAYDAVLMDVQMPVMNGLEATQHIRTSPDFAHVAHVPIIAITAYAMKEDQGKFLAAGMDGYLSKPVEADQLMEVLAQLENCPPSKEEA